MIYGAFNHEEERNLLKIYVFGAIWLETRGSDPSLFEYDWLFSVRQKSERFIDYHLSTRVANPSEIRPKDLDEFYMANLCFFY